MLNWLFFFFLQGLVRIGKKEYESDRAKMYGPVDQWHHVDCFVKKRADLEFFECADILPGYNTLSADDKTMLKSKLKKIERKRKAEDEPDAAPKKIKKKEEDAVRKQSNKMFQIRDELKKILHKRDMMAILEYNEHPIPEGESRMLDMIVDIMTFGTMEFCDVCKNGKFYYSSGVGYKCDGDISEWTKCTNIVQEPKRKPFVIPEELEKAHSYLAAYKFKGVGKRIWIDHGPSTVEVAKKREEKALKTEPLQGMNFVLVGDGIKNKSTVKSKIKELGGTVSNKVDVKTTAVITSLDLIDGTNAKIATAKSLDVHCVSQDFLDEVDGGGAAIIIQKKSIAPWGGDVNSRIKQPKSSTKSKFESRFTKSIPEKQRVTLKGGAVVDPDSGLEDRAHVYQRGKKIYNCVLGHVNVQTGTNSYYKLQLLESDKQSRFVI